jgi:hypothetical protein
MKQKKPTPSMLENKDAKNTHTITGSPRSRSLRGPTEDAMQDDATKEGMTRTPPSSIIPRSRPSFHFANQMDLEPPQQHL